MEDGHGFILQEKEDYRLKSQSVFVPKVLVLKNGLKTGQFVKGNIRAKMEESSCPVLLEVFEVMGVAPEDATRVTPFTELVPYYPLERMYLETQDEVDWDNVSMRVVDLVSPVGFGQRGLIVAPPRTGKTVLQQSIARALRQNNPKAHLIVLLVDERPEEVTDFRRQVPDAEVIASTFDESAESHVHAAEIVIEKARRMVEHNQDVVILSTLSQGWQGPTIQPCRTVGKFLVVELRLPPCNVLSVSLVLLEILKMVAVLLFLVLH